MTTYRASVLWTTHQVQEAIALKCIHDTVSAWLTSHQNLPHWVNNHWTDVRYVRSSRYNLEHQATAQTTTQFDPTFPKLVHVVLEWCTCFLCSSNSEKGCCCPFMHNTYHVSVCFVCQYMQLQAYLNWSLYLVYVYKYTSVLVRIYIHKHHNAQLVGLLLNTHYDVSDVVQV